MSEARAADETPAIPPKEDPETLVLRGAPRPVVRFRRGLIIGISAAVAGTVATVTWFALEPASFRLAAEEEGGGDPLRKAAPDALAKAPASYGDVPRLGPPLPGDLGRPILEHQRILDQGASVSDHGPPAGADAGRDAAEAERQRLAAAREAARASGVIVQLQGGARAVPRPDGAAADAEPATPDAVGSRPSRADLSGTAAGDTNPHPLRRAPSPWTLSAGTIIPASLITGLNSDLPGTVIAQVTENVRDSATGRTILVPQGARLIGSYDSAVGYGQRRALLVWQRIIFPDGSSVGLDNMPATDPSGFAGVEGQVDFHTWRLLKGIALATLLGVGTELTFGSGEREVVKALRESSQQNAARSGDQITSRNLAVKPTITVPPGWPLRAVVREDLVLRPWKG